MLGRYFDGVQCSINMARRAQSDTNTFNSGPEIREWLEEILDEQRDKILAEFKRQKLNSNACVPFLNENNNDQDDVDESLLVTEPSQVHDVVPTQTIYICPSSDIKSLWYEYVRFGI